ncbi:TetR/AcrR family transcriptional regulator [Rubellimicrobium arenae]|uniref:TetR/AcrR family transcriptional regulator n=1 Tax=Rubellimicrobium arenae TaxID=2817372 RepID=UPI001B317973|nr:TetR/AcrR family transcriptional regulator [Rubellimicrobium arenae]
MRHETLPDAKSTETLEAGQRGDEILSLARQAFVEKGFDGASMQDLARAAGMSAGNFYRYFPSKAALVEAMITHDLDEVERTFQEIVISPDPLMALKAALRERLDYDCEKDHPLWAEIMATAARKPEVAGLFCRMEEGIVQRIVQVLAIVSQTPEDLAMRRFGAYARLIVLIVRGAAMGDVDGGGQKDELNTLILNTIDRLMDDALAGGEDD